MESEDSLSDSRKAVIGPCPKPLHTVYTLTSYFFQKLLHYHPSLFADVYHEVSSLNSVILLQRQCLKKISL